MLGTPSWALDAAVATKVGLGDIGACASGGRRSAFPVGLSKNSVPVRATLGEISIHWTQSLTLARSCQASFDGGIMVWAHRSPLTVWHASIIIIAASIEAVCAHSREIVALLVGFIGRELRCEGSASRGRCDATCSRSSFWGQGGHNTLLSQGLFPGCFWGDMWLIRGGKAATTTGSRWRFAVARLVQQVCTHIFTHLALERGLTSLT